MKIIKCIIFYSLLLIVSFLSAAEFTISSYNCGGLSDHYDYLRAGAMQKLIQERANAEPENMALNDELQKLALQIRFSSGHEKLKAQLEWKKRNYQKLFEQLTSSPTEPNSPNATWNKKSNQIITSYKIRPIEISDKEVNQMIDDHLSDLSNIENGTRDQNLDDVRNTMAIRAFAHHLKYDIICLQEADYLNPTQFPKNYEVVFSDSTHSLQAIAWNKDRFDLIENIGDILGKGYVIKLRDKVTGKSILVASGHITGCNPYRVQKDPDTGVSDSAKGDNELQKIVELMENIEADIRIIGMDSNVTSLHPRLKILEEGSYQLDYKNHLETTCTNPYQVLNTRIDWIALKSDKKIKAMIRNIPIYNIGLNSIQTNMSDHKPIAAKIVY